MKPLHASSATEALRDVRSARLDDRDELSKLISSESHVHKHLDWKAPLEWLEHKPFIVLQEGAHLLGALACAPDPDSIAWLRLFVHTSHLSGSTAWRLLWPPALSALEANGGATAAAIAMHRWLDPILAENGFELVNHIVLMEMHIQEAHLPRGSCDCVIRPMLPEDLPRVVDLDSEAFEPLWRNSLEAVAHGFGQASYASIAEDESGLLGYQLSTDGAFGTHLARLAVLPAAQGRGLGAALVKDLIEHIPASREPRLTVNTQSNNAASHALYARLGFQRTGERFPVFALEVGAADPARKDGMART